MINRKSCPYDRISKIRLVDIFPGKVFTPLYFHFKLWTLKDLLFKTEKDLLSIRGFGKKRLEIVRETLSTLGLKL